MKAVFCGSLSVLYSKMIKLLYIYTFQIQVGNVCIVKVINLVTANSVT